MTTRSHHIAAAAIAGLGVATVAVVSGLTVVEFIRFAAFEAYFVALPGIVVYTARARTRPLLERVAFGWALGYVLAIGAFVATRTLGVPGLVSWYPIPVLVAAFVVLRTSTAPERSVIGIGPRTTWVMLAVGGLAFGYFAVGSFLPTPLLGPEVTSVSYYPDLVFGQSLAAESMHQWPVTLPSVAGVELNYHWFAFWQMGSIADISGLELDRVVLRAFYLPLVPVLILQLLVAGQALFGSIRAGILGVAATLLAGEWDFDRVANQPFLGGVIDSFYFSPSTLFGAIFFVPLLVFGGRLLAKPTYQTWLLAMVFAIAASGAKASALPVLIGGAIGVIGWNAIRRHPVKRSHLIVAATLIAAFGVGYLTLYRNASAGVTVGIGDYLTASPMWQLMMRRSSGMVAGVIAGSIALGGMLAPLAGMVIRPRRSEHRAWLAWCVAAGVTATYLVSQPGLSQGYLLIYALIAGGVLSGAGLDRGIDFLAETMSARRIGVTWLLWLGIGTYVIVYGHRAVSGWGLRLLPQARMAVMLLSAIVMVLVFVALVAQRAQRAGTATPVVAVVAIAVVSLALLDAPLDSEAIISNSRAGHIAATAGDYRGVTGELVDGLRWVRDATPSYSVLAVNNHHLGRDGTDARFFYYSAYAERRVVLESWSYSPAALDAAANGVGGVVPYADRAALLDRLYDGDGSALTALVQDYGLTHVVNDKVNGPGAGGLSTLMPLVFSNQAIDVYAVPDLKASVAAADEP